MAAVSSFSTKEKREEGARSVKLVDLVFFFGYVWVKIPVLCRNPSARHLPREDLQLISRFGTC